ncbi:hypothetical protein Tco_1554570 [Tanacetum coccineum]
MEEKMAAIADQFAKWLDIISSSNARLETTLQKLTCQTTTLKMSPMIPSPTPTPTLPRQHSRTSTPRSQLKFILSRCHLRLPTRLIGSQKSYTRWPSSTAIYTPFTPAAASSTIATILVPDMLTNPPKQTDALPLHRLSPKEIQIICSQGLCFQCPETFHLGRHCPPKFVFLHREPEPPWNHVT